VLIDQNRVSVRIGNHKARRAVRVHVGLGNHAYASLFELALQHTNVREFSKWLCIAAPARVEGDLSSPFGLALDAAGGPIGVGGVIVPALTWKGLMALGLMMALIGAVAVRRLS